MPYQYEHLMKLTPNELHNQLTKRDLPPTTIERIKAIVNQQKAALKSERAKAIKVKAEWQPLTEGLRMERESLRSMRNYAQKKSGHSDPETITALEGYALVLDKLHEEFTAHIRNGITPAVLSKQRNLPNNGIHWSDWVKDRFKERVSAMFAAIPPKPRTKAKTPFARTTTAKSNDRLRERLRTRTLKEHDIATQDNQLNPTERNKARVSKLAEALRRIDKLDLNEPVPRTWSGLFIDEGEVK